MRQDYPTIQEAINAAEENTLIKVDEGLYRENLVITKPNIFLEPKKTSEVYLVGKNGPTILVDIPVEGGNTVNIQGFKITNKGIRKVSSTQNTNVSEYNLSQYRDVLRMAADTEKSPEAECLIYVKRGMLSIYDCHFTCNLFFKTSGKFVSCVYAAANAQCMINECHFKGSTTCVTNGITSFEGNVSVRNSDFRGFLGSGVTYVMTPRNIGSVTLCKVSECYLGVCLLRQNSRTKVSDCQITSCDIGCLVGCGGDLLITKSEINLNRLGIKVIAGDPQICDNTICHNKRNGIEVVSDGLLTEAKLSKNLIHDNEKYGVKFTGHNNMSQLHQNRIFLNRKAGILTKNRVAAILVKNDIFKNLAQGVCIQESSSVFAESNLIRENIKANLAVGGRSERETILLRNVITDGRCEGVFLMETIMTRLFSNTITNNHFGVMVVNSSLSLVGNTISNNMAHGLMVLKKSNVVISQNVIKGNLNIGIFLRDACKGSIENNRLSDNKIEILIEQRCTDFDQVLDPSKGNQIEGDVRVPSISVCLIF